jgi:prepilin-type N-terminal cleavage/methylation domain-containing protein
MIIQFFRKILPQRSAESGFTLIEMLVAMTIASVFFASFTAVVIATVQTMKTGDQRTVAQQNSRIAVNFMADEVKQMQELETPSFSEYRDLKTGGLPRNGEVVDGFFNEVYPIHRQSTDGSARGYIDLENANASGGDDEYEEFRTDGMPFDVRPLFPNKLNFTMNQSEFFPHTRYSSMDPNLVGGTIDLDGLSFDLANNSDNAQSGSVRVSYEHQKQPPRFGLLHDAG